MTTNVAVAGVGGASVQTPRRGSRRWPVLRIILTLGAFDASLGLAAIAFYKKGSRPLTTFIPAPAGIAFVVAVVAMAALVAVCLHDARRRRAPVGYLLLGNVAAILFLFAITEAIVRSLTVDSPDGPTVAGTLLLPRSWSTVVARNRQALIKSAQTHSYLVYDRELGWTNGTNRRSGEYSRELIRRYMQAHASMFGPPAGIAALDATARPDEDIYYSSTEGIRSPRPGMSYAAIPAKRRIALVGDSFAFGLESNFAETWGNQLERALPPGTQVLNFGVDGYGLDQAYLRARRDALPWHPQTVILSVIDDDLRRAMCVYGFLCFPGFEMPFPKPRLVLNGGHLEALNEPLPSPDSVFAHPTIAELPYIQDDIAYDPAEWEEHAHLSSRTVRYALSKFRRWTAPSPAVDERSMRALSAVLFEAFVHDAREQGATPIILYFPSRTFFLPMSARPASLAKEVLDAAHLDYVDMTSCVARVPDSDRFTNLHYSAATNAAVARCLAQLPAVRGSN